MVVYLRKCTVLPQSEVSKQLKSKEGKVVGVELPMAIHTEQQLDIDQRGEDKGKLIVNNNINHKLITEIIKEGNYRSKLIEEILIVEAGTLEYYTDGSLINRGEEEVRMGMVWIRIKNKEEISLFKCGVYN